MFPIKVAVADDHLISRQGLIKIITHHTDVEIVFEASNGQELLDCIAEKQPDVVLMDIKMPVLDGLKATAFLHEQHRHIKVLALSMYDDEAYIIRMLQAGAKGYLLKNADAPEIMEAIRTVYNKNYYFNDQVSTAMLKEILTDEKVDWNIENAAITITDREKLILELICRQYTNQEIGDLLSMSTRTVEGHRLKLMKKTRTKTTIGLVVFAMKNKLVEI